MDVIPLRPSAIQAVAHAAQRTQEQRAEGRIFSAQVLQLLDGGSMVLGVGRARVAATSQAALQVGQNVFLRFRGTGPGRVLELVGQEELEATGDSPDVSHPFRWLARGQGLGELIADLSQALTAGAERASPAARELERALGRFALSPGASGSDVARLVANSAISHEARALGRALDSLPSVALAAAAKELVSLALGDLPEDAVGPLRRALGQELARLLGDVGELERLRALAPDASAGHGLATRALQSWIGRALESSFPPTLHAAQRSSIAEALQFARIAPRLARAVIEALLGESAGLARVLDEPAMLRTVATTPDLKQWLAEAMATLDPGVEREAVRQALETLEAEQFVALARARHGEGSSWVLALCEHGGFTDARLVHRRVESGEPEPGVEREGPVERAVLGLEFSRTGPVRADFALDRSALRVRLSVADEAIAERMNAAIEELSAALSSTGRSVQVTICVRAKEELRVPGPEADSHLAAGRPAVDRLG